MSLITNLRAYLQRSLTSFTAVGTPARSQSPSGGEPPPKCRYRLDNDSSDTLTLPDGRNLGCSRLEAAGYDDLGLKLGARIIAADRPGYGWSSSHPDRTLLDYPKDIEYLANHLKLDEYSVLGVSGGGPYALVCAMSLSPDKLKSVSIVCGLGPPDIGMRGADFIHWIGFPYGWRYSPAILLRWFLQRDPAARLDWSDEKRFEVLQQQIASSKATTHKKDLEVTTDEDFLRLFLRSSRESYAQGFDGTLQDGKVMCTDFAFRIEDIRHDLPIQLWYGKHDTHVPLNHGEQIAARLGGRATFRVEDETHASISQHWKSEQLEALIKSM
ncbi:alpha/beta hydrolase fold protein [Mollisia scopiformis]|uniref:Alpha/beta hydrolase fold protein n=1 Tax=Mollisia scopiformis TaxID=149040 RepID=A0A194WXZ4_MOLSC|nr:alpha/beta hydrolase fold protein [Mollisia scopiformis]KUJ12846.1 alpha/beta hydrolase fold protein [Mollisia scopiformis]